MINSFMQTNNTVRFVSCICLICAFYSCHPNPESDKKIVPAASKGINPSAEIKFKDWAKDSLHILLNGEIKTNEISYEFNSRERVRKISIATDTSSIKIEDTYTVDIEPLRLRLDTLPKDVATVFSLLKSSDELPDRKFKLSFSAFTFYSPSPVEQLAYNFIFEYKNIRIDIPGAKTVIFYSYNRGSLRQKVAQKEIPPCAGCLSSAIETTSNFIYDDLSKREKLVVNNAIRTDVIKIK